MKPPRTQTPAVIQSGVVLGPAPVISERIGAIVPPGGGVLTVGVTTGVPETVSPVTVPTCTPVDVSITATGATGVTAPIGVVAIDVPAGTLTVAVGFESMAAVTAGSVLVLGTLEIPGRIVTGSGGFGKIWAGGIEITAVLDRCQTH